MGGTVTTFNRTLKEPAPLESDQHIGLTNFGNTCYCNSVVQALYYCRPFREKVLAYRLSSKGKENIMTCLKDLFISISQHGRKSAVQPKKFVSRLKKEKDQFNNYLQQDAHEFLIFLLNTITEIIQAEKVREGEKEQLHTGGSFSSLNSSTSHSSGVSASTSGAKPSSSESTWVQEMFEGILTNETKCLICETVSSKDESFLDLSVEIEQNTSISYCLRNFSSIETLTGEHKYLCEVCSTKQEAQKIMRIKKPPQILILHLKRFKYMDQLQRYTKLSYRITFPLELRLFNTSADSTHPDRLYTLSSVVVHCGTGPNRGHYIALVKSQGSWVLIDDDLVEKVDPHLIEQFFGLSADVQKSSECAYILVYESKEGHSVTV